MKLGRFAAASLVLYGCWSLACSVREAPPTGEIVEDALPSGTNIPPGWTGGAGDGTQVDDGWIKSFGDAQLESLVEEAMRVDNPSLRIMSSQVNRAAAA